VSDSNSDHPPDYFRIKIVNSFHELVTTPFDAGINALCWQRQLAGDFGEIVEKLGVTDGIVSIEDEDLQALDLSDAGKAARDILLADQELLRAHELSPNLDCVHTGLREMDGEPVPTDVYSFHVDSATTVADTYLCTYYGATSEGLRNEEAVRKVEVPETRAALLKRYGGEDDDAFREYLRDNCYDLHYAPLPDAQPYTFGIGNLWRIAIQYPGCPVPPCIHRAPTTQPGHMPRLLLIS
jgi:hypothetical protein